jgi:hypothetical protein
MNTDMEASLALEIIFFSRNMHKIYVTLEEVHLSQNKLDRKI